jgi:predicted component of type VI protein secretion system
MPRLRFVSDVAGVNVIDLFESTITIGREASNLISVDDPNISKHHALLIKEDGGYRIFDLHSANGTWVNDQPITVAKLNDGDTVGIGHIALRYETAAAKTIPAGLGRLRPGPAPATPAVTESKPAVAGPRLSLGGRPKPAEPTAPPAPQPAEPVAQTPPPIPPIIPVEKPPTPAPPLLPPAKEEKRMSIKMPAEKKSPEPEPAQAPSQPASATPPRLGFGLKRHAPAKPASEQTEPSEKAEAPQSGDKPPAGPRIRLRRE